MPYQLRPPYLGVLQPANMIDGNLIQEDGKPMPTAVLPPAPTCARCGANGKGSPATGAGTVPGGVPNTVAA